MRKSTETLYRQWALLQNMPRYPSRATTGDLHARIVDEGFEVDKRTTERDLKSLLNMPAFALDYEEDGRTRYWFWQQDIRGTEIPGMGRDVAFSFRLAQGFLAPLMPPGILNSLNDYFERAHAVLEGTHLAAWLSKVQVLTRGPVLQAPPIDHEVRDVVYGALLKDQRFDVDYAGRDGQIGRYEVNPLGLVVRDGVFYLVATLWDYQDVRQLALHRMTNASAQGKSAHHPPDFDLGHYVNEQFSFAYPHQAAAIRLRVLFDEAAAYHLGERRLSDDQRLESTEDGRVLVEATVPDTAELRWWLLGFGAQVELLEPADLRDEFSDIADSMFNLYKGA